MDKKAEQATSSSPATAQSTPISDRKHILPRPQFFVSRNDGSLTPLVAVDELPSSIHIIGVPPVISQAETINMISLGVKERTQIKYIVETIDSSASGNSGNQVSARSDPRLSESSNQTLELPVVKKMPEVGVQNVEEWRHSVDGVDETQATIDAVIAANEKTHAVPASRTRNAATPGTFGKKVYCTHWIRWGECDYTQQGCLYKHEMPDVETLISIGVRAYPKWYRDSNALNNGWNGRPAPADQVWRSGHTPSAQLPQASGTFHSVQDEERHRLASDSFRSTPAPAPTVRGSTYQRGRKAVTFPSFPNPAAAVPRFSSYHATAIEPRSRHTVASTFHSFPNKTIATRSSISAPLIPDPTPLTSLTNHNYDPVSPFNNLPSSSAPNHLSLLPFLASSPTLQAQAPCPEVKTPAPRHRRLFVPPGEPKYVSNTAPGTSKDGFRIKKDLKANKKNKGNLDEGLGLKKEIEELLVDFEG